MLRMVSPVPASILLGAALLAATSVAAARDVTFFHISDQHYSEEAENPAALEPTIQAMNRLPGTPYPEGIGGKVDAPRGVILTGDLTDAGTLTEWEMFESDWGLTGEEGLLNYPLYEGAGNHDGAPSTAQDETRGVVRRRIIERNPHRPGVTNISENGLHYSWDWDDVHFVMLNEYAGPEDDERYAGNPEYHRKMQRYGNPAQESLQFLRRDLATQVGDSDRPVILMQHYGLGPFPLHPWGHEAAWWTEEHAMRLWEAIEGYNVISLLAGHDGSEAVIDWNGIPNRHMDDAHRFGVYHIGEETMTVARRNAESGRWEAVDTQPTQVNASRPPELVQGPYLVYGGEPGTMTVLWRTSENVNATLHWGDDRFEYEDGTVEVRPYDAERHLYRHTITGLDPERSTQFAVEINGRFAPGMFYAAPAGAEKVKFLIVGSQPDAAGRNALHATLYRKIYEDPAYHSIILHPGKMVENLDSLRDWDRGFFSRGEAARHVRWMLRRAPLAVAPGGSELKRRLFPVGGEVAGAYAFDYGPVHLATLNADAGLAPGSVQRHWLRASLEATTATWKVVMWNAPENEAVGRQLIEQLKPICEEFGVDLCVSGGVQTEPLRRNGTLYLAPGLLSVAVTAEPEALTCDLFDASGQKVETLTIEPLPARAAAPVTNGPRLAKAGP